MSNYPLDKTANAAGRRSSIPLDGPDDTPENPRRQSGELPPLLAAILQEYSATGLPPAYLPKTLPGPHGELS